MRADLITTGMAPTRVALLICIGAKQSRFRVQGRGLSEVSTATFKTHTHLVNQIGITSLEVYVKTWVGRSACTRADEPAGL